MSGALTAEGSDDKSTALMQQLCLGNQLGSPTVSLHSTTDWALGPSSVPQWQFWLHEARTVGIGADTGLHHCQLATFAILLLVSWTLRAEAGSASKQEQAGHPASACPGALGTPPETGKTALKYAR